LWRGESGDFSILIAIGIDVEKQCLINHPDSYRDVCGERNRAFWVGAVSGSAFFLHLVFSRYMDP